MSVQKFDRKRGSWDAVPRGLIQDSPLSAEALGVWLYIYTKPETWVPREADVRDRFAFGRDKYLRVMRELREHGLVFVADARNEKGQIMDRTLVVTAEPVTDSSVSLTSENPTLGKPDPLYKKRGLEKKRDKDGGPGQAESPFQLPPTIDAKVWGEWVEYRKEIRKPMTPKSARLNARVLESLKPQEQREVVEKAIRSQWQGLYAPKPNPKGKQDSIREVVL